MSLRVASASSGPGTSRGLGSARWVAWARTGLSRTVAQVRIESIGADSSRGLGRSWFVALVRCGLERLVT